ncbi:hypothetical protein JXJ21_07855 [candidate division KSB1 bacterium]|nr:hypothetical protein [candidate division KSB1 bacterium]
MLVEISTYQIGWAEAAIFGFLSLMLMTAGALLSTPRKADYLAQIEKIIRHNLEQSQQIIDNWKGNITRCHLFGYSTTSYPAVFAELLGFMYRQTGDETYVRAAVNLLLQYEEFKQIFPKEFYADRIEYAKGLPPISDFFSMSAYPHAYLYIKDSTEIEAADRATIEKGVKDCATFLLNYPEWGPMNRAILRAETFLYSYQSMPHHQNALKWKKIAEVLSRDSYQQWEEEDAASYHPVWLLSLMRYVHSIHDENFYRSAVPRFYFDYFSNLITPAGLIPDFGDAHWPTETTRWLAIFEKAAAVYKEPRYKWAAANFWNKERQSENLSAGLGLVLADAYQWSDETIEPEPIESKSRLVMEDVIGKKIVFRNGIDSDSTYLLVNYRNEGDGAFTPREFLRTTITAEEEKTHHGHSDENSIPCLFSGGSLLLHDAGYRDQLPSGEYGRYRADYFHNRLVVRKNKRWFQIQGETKQEQSILEFIRNSGAYRPVDTKLIDFFNFKQVDMSRSRLTDLELGYEWDRIVVYHKRDDFFMVIDGVKILHKDFFTFTNLWHTEKILYSNRKWYDTRIEKVGNYPASGNKNLLIYFPLTATTSERSNGTFELVRHNQPERSIFETVSSNYLPGHFEVFVTILFPHKPNADVSSIIKRFKLLKPEKYPQAVGLKYTTNSSTDYVGVKLDLEMDYHQENYRPRYAFDYGKVKYADFTTDGSFLFASCNAHTLYWACTNMVKLMYNKQVLHESRLNSFGLQPGKKPKPINGQAKWRYWEDESEIIST